LLFWLRPVRQQFLSAHLKITKDILFQFPQTGAPTMTLTKENLIQALQNHPGFTIHKSANLIESILEIIKSFYSQLYYFYAPLLSSLPSRCKMFSFLASQQKRKQIYLDEESDRALKTLSLTTKVSESEHIRRAVKKYIEKQKSEIAVEDPLQKLIGLCDKPKGPTDASIHHDKYLIC